MITQAQCNDQTADDLLVKPHKAAWWKEAVVYQVYPASFADSTGVRRTIWRASLNGPRKLTLPLQSGIGDLRGILSKIPYLRSLGIDVVWMSPICASPNVDMGYDISNYVGECIVLMTQSFRLIASHRNRPSLRHQARL